MKYKVNIAQEAEKEIRRLSAKDRQRIMAAILSLAGDPFSGKKLKGKGSRLIFSLRVWPFRIIYQVFKNELLVLVIRVGQRKDVYRNFI